MTAPAPCVGILLAAGKSERMGRPKALLELRGETFIARAARILRRAGINRILVVASEPVAGEIRGLPPDCEILINPKPEEGMISSIRLAAARISEGSSAVISLVDTPEIEPWMIARLRAAAPREEKAVILIPRFEDGDGHPVLLPPRGLSRLADPLPKGLKTLIEIAGPRAVRIPFGGLRPLDCDLPETYEDLVERHEKKSLAPPPPMSALSLFLSTALLFLAAAAAGLFDGAPILRRAEEWLYFLFAAAAVAGALRGLLEDRTRAEDLVPITALFLALGAQRREFYPGATAYLVEALTGAFLLFLFQSGVFVGRILRAPPGRSGETASLRATAEVRGNLLGTIAGGGAFMFVASAGSVSPSAGGPACFAILAAAAAAGFILVRREDPPLPYLWAGVFPPLFSPILSLRDLGNPDFVGAPVVLFGGPFLWAGLTGLSLFLGSLLGGARRS